MVGWKVVAIAMLLLGTCLFVSSAASHPGTHNFPTGGGPMPSRAALHPRWNELGPAAGSEAAPVAAPGVTFIWANGSVSNASAPISVSGSEYTLTAGFIGGLVDERNGSVLNGGNHVVQPPPGLPFAVMGFQSSHLVVENFNIVNATIGIDLGGVRGALLRLNSINATSWAIRADDSSDLSIVGNVALRSSGISFDSVAALNVTSNTVSGSTATGIQVDQGSNISIEGNRAVGTPVGISATNSDGVVVLDNDLSGSAIGLHESGVSSSQIRHNLDDSSTTAISIENSSQVTLVGDEGRNGTFGLNASSVSDLSITTSNFSEFTHGLAITSATNVSVTSCNLTRDGNGAEVRFSNLVSVVRNNLSYFAQAGLLVTYSSNVEATANLAQYGLQPGSAGFVTMGDHLVTLTRNVATHDAYGEIDAYGTNLTLVGNSLGFTVGPHAGISLTSDTGVILESNFVVNPSYFGLEASGTQRLTVVGNNLSCAGYAAISLTQVTQALVTNNYVDHAGNFGIYLAESSSLVVDDNPGGYTLNGSGVGVYAVQVVAGTIFLNNATHASISFQLVSCVAVQLLDNNGSSAGTGVWLDGDVNTTVAANTFGSDHWGFWARANSGVSVYHNNFVNDSAWTLLPSVQTIAWDAEYPEGGNFWSNFSGPDLRSGSNQSWQGADGLVDHPFVLNGSNVDRYPLTAPWFGYSITFTETGLASATPWGVDVNGAWYPSYRNTLVVPLTNGPEMTYQFTVPRVVGYLPSTPAAGGPWPESRANVTITLVFVPFLFPVVFQEFGLVNGTVWNVIVGSHTVTLTSSIGESSLANGTYPYVAGKVGGYSIGSGSGSFVMQGASARVARHGDGEQ